MTLIAIACKGDSAEYVTDSIAYSPSFRHVAHTTKGFPLHHLGAAVLCQGNAEFGDQVCALMRGLSEGESFDELVERAPSELAGLWAAGLKQGADWSGTVNNQARAFLIGYSESEGEYVTVGMFSEDDFADRLLADMFILPTPWGLYPNLFETTGFADDTHDEEDRVWAVEQLAAWRSRPEVTAPASLDDWVELVRMARGRAITEFKKHPVGGKVFHTILTRNATSTALLCEFDNTTESLLQLVGYTLHPLAQVRPCYCDSGKRYIDCHLAEEADDLCRCGSEKALRTCCMLTDE